MLTFGWGEILLFLIVVIIVVGPKDLPKLIKQLTSFSKSIKKLSREFKSSLNDISKHDDFKDVKNSLKEVDEIKKDLNFKENFNSEIKSIKDTNDLLKKETEEIKNISNISNK